MLYFTFISCLLFRGTLSYKLTKNRKLCLEFDCFIIVKISELHFRFGAFDFSHICFSVCMCVIFNRFVDLYMCTGVSVYVRGLVFYKNIFHAFSVTMIRCFLEEKRWNSKHVVFRFMICCVVSPGSVSDKLWMPGRIRMCWCEGAFNSVGGIPLYEGVSVSLITFSSCTFVC